MRKLPPGVVEAIGTGAYFVLAGSAVGYCWGAVHEWSSNDLAAWMQAVGSIVAVGVAIYVPWRQREVGRLDVEAERLLKARSLAIALLPHVLHVRDRAQKAFGPAAEIRGEVRRDSHTVAAIKVDVPDILIGQIDKVYILGDVAGTSVQMVVASAREYYRSLDGNYIDGEKSFNLLHAIESAANKAERALLDIVNG